MKSRIESEGVHFYDRSSGIHILLDEIDTSKVKTAPSPRTVSIGITNKCNLNCDYCYVAKGNKVLDKEYIVQIAKKFDKLDSIDIAIGGGEPFLHPNLIEICKEIWTQTSLGVSITTNGTLLTEDNLIALKGYVSIIRISIDGVFEVYESNRKFQFTRIIDNISLTANHHRVGLNVIIKDDTINQLDTIAEIYQRYDCAELLLLPVVKNGKMVLSESIKSKLEKWISLNNKTINLRLLSSAKTIINVNYLFSYPSWESPYVYIDVDKNIRPNSYTSFGVAINSLDNMEDYIKQVMA